MFCKLRFRYAFKFAACATSSDFSAADQKHAAGTSQNFGTRYNSVVVNHATQTADQSAMCKPRIQSMVDCRLLNQGLRRLVWLTLTPKAHLIPPPERRDRLGRDGGVVLLWRGWRWGWIEPHRFCVDPGGLSFAQEVHEGPPAAVLERQRKL